MVFHLDGTAPPDNVKTKMLNTFSQQNSSRPTTANHVHTETARQIVTDSPNELYALFEWMTCQGMERKLTPISPKSYVSSIESREPGNRNLLLTSNSPEPREKPDGITSILHSPRSVNPRGKRGNSVRWRDHQLATESTMFMNTNSCSWRSALADVVDDSAQMRSTSKSLRKQAIARFGESAPKSSFSNSSSTCAFGLQNDPIVAFREGNLYRKRDESFPGITELYSDEGIKLRNSMQTIKLKRAPSPHPKRLISLEIKQEQPLLDQPQSATLPLPEEKPKAKITASPKIVHTPPDTSRFAEIKWKSRNPKIVDDAKIRQPSERVAKIVAKINGNRKKPVLSEQEICDGSPPSYSDIPTLASYDESTVITEDWAQSRYTPDDGNFAVI